MVFLRRCYTVFETAAEIYVDGRSKRHPGAAAAATNASVEGRGNSKMIGDRVIEGTKLEGLILKYCGVK